jgi:hypothetical protein
MHDSSGQIKQALENGQFRYAVKLSATFSRPKLAELINHFQHDLNNPSLALQFVKAWFKYSE